MTAEEYVAKYEEGLLESKDAKIFVETVSCMMDDMVNELFSGDKETAYNEFGDRLDKQSAIYDEVVDILKNKHKKSPIKKGMFYSFIMKKIARAACQESE